MERSDLCTGPDWEAQKNGFLCLFNVTICQLAVWALLPLAVGFISCEREEVNLREAPEMSLNLTTTICAKLASKGLEA